MSVKARDPLWGWGLTRDYRAPSKMSHDYPGHARRMQLHADRIEALGLDGPQWHRRPPKPRAKRRRQPEPTPLPPPPPPEPVRVVAVRRCKLRSVAWARQDAILAMYESFTTPPPMEWMAGLFGCDRHSIYYAVERAAARRAAGKVTPPAHPAILVAPPAGFRPGFHGREAAALRYEQARALRKQGYSLPEIARMVGLRSHASVRRACGVDKSVVDAV